MKTGKSPGPSSQNIYTWKVTVLLSLITMHVYQSQGNTPTTQRIRKITTMPGVEFQILPPTASFHQRDQDEPQCGQALDGIMIYLPREEKEQDQLQ